jgi:hypothetical protein
MDSIGIGTLAKRTGVGIDTVRYYERNGRAADCPILNALGGDLTP